MLSARKDKSLLFQCSRPSAGPGSLDNLKRSVALLGGSLIQASGTPTAGGELKLSLVVAEAGSGRVIPMYGTVFCAAEAFDAVALALRGTEGVAWVTTQYVGDVGEFPMDPYQHLQTYLGLAPQGVGAEYAWNFPGGQGTGVKVGDVELGGWWLEHPDLKGNNFKKLCSDCLGNNPNHGTAALGIMAARRNQVGIVGIAPDLEAIIVALPEGTAPEDLSTAIRKATSLLSSGDVLLLDVQAGGGRPIEAGSGGILRAIKDAAATGVIVIEAGGDADNAAWEPREESHAIIVGSAKWQNGSWKATHDFSDRIDVFAGVEPPPFTCRYDLLLYTVSWRGLDVIAEEGPWGTTLNDTSAAAPIVAGVAAVIQGIWKANHANRPITPDDLRKLLRGRENCTAVTKKRGIPDLAKIIPRLQP